MAAMTGLGHWKGMRGRDGGHHWGREWGQRWGKGSWWDGHPHPHSHLLNDVEGLLVPADEVVEVPADAGHIISIRLPGIRCEVHDVEAWQGGGRGLP